MFISLLLGLLSHCHHHEQHSLWSWRFATRLLPFFICLLSTTHDSQQPRGDAQCNDSVDLVRHQYQDLTATKSKKITKAPTHRAVPVAAVSAQQKAGAVKSMQVLFFPVSYDLS